jgi:hypothetical protein
MDGFQTVFQSQSVRKSKLSIKAKESLMEVPCDIYLKMKCEALSIPEFQICKYKEHLELSRLGTSVLLRFGTTYLCEKQFQQ